MFRLRKELVIVLCVSNYLFNSKTNSINARKSNLRKEDDFRT